MPRAAASRRSSISCWFLRSHATPRAQEKLWKGEQFHEVFWIDRRVGMDAIYGVTMEKMAELMAKHGELKAQYGEREGEGQFEAYLAQQGLDMNTFAHAWNGWWERFRADPTGRLETQFTMLQ